MIKISIMIYFRNCHKCCLFLFAVFFKLSLRICRLYTHRTAQPRSSDSCSYRRTKHYPNRQSPTQVRIKVLSVQRTEIPIRIPSALPIVTPTNILPCPHRVYQVSHRSWNHHSHVSANGNYPVKYQ